MRKISEKKLLKRREIIVNYLKEMIPCELSVSDIHDEYYVTIFVYKGGNVISGKTISLLCGTAKNRLEEIKGYLWEGSDSDDNE